MSPYGILTTTPRISRITVRFIGSGTRDPFRRNKTHLHHIRLTRYRVTCNRSKQREAKGYENKNTFKTRSNRWLENLERYSGMRQYPRDGKPGTLSDVGPSEGFYLIPLHWMLQSHVVPHTVGVGEGFGARGNGTGG